MFGHLFVPNDEAHVSLLQMARHNLTRLPRVSLSCRPNPQPQRVPWCDSLQGSLSGQLYKLIDHIRLAYVRSFDILAVPSAVGYAGPVGLHGFSTCKHSGTSERFPTWPWRTTGIRIKSITSTLREVVQTSRRLQPACGPIEYHRELGAAQARSSWLVECSSEHTLYRPKINNRDDSQGIGVWND